MKRLLKDRRGMTLMEIVVALALLLLVIVGTTPVMLSAFDGVYKAGEKTQEVYDAKTEIEQKLASRNSSINYKGFIVNFNGLGQSIKVNGNRAVSSLYNSLETLFTGAKARVYIASGSVVNDDASSHDIILQTSNIDFESINEIGVNGEKTLSPRDDKTAEIETLVDINAYIPQKELTSTLAADIYKNQKATVTLNTTTTNVETGRIGITIAGTAENPIDFTTSPIKIVLEYLDENDKPQKVHTYLTIKTSTIMFAGETNSNITYYTTAGVKKNINKDGTYTTSFTAEARKMNIGKFNDGGQHITGAQSTIAVPTDTVFKSINWITEYEKTTGGTGNENVDFASTPYDPQYYVLTGTNGAIYRTYSFNQPAELLGKVNLTKLNKNGNRETYDKTPGINGYNLNSKTNVTQNGIDVMGVKDNFVVLDDRASTIVYPAVWGGDFSHIFGWSSYEDEMGYISRRTVTNTQPSSAKTWQTEDVNTSGIGEPGYYSNLASFGYYYNGWGTKDRGFHTINSRKISYVLTEVPDSIRIGGLLNGVGSTDDDEYGYDGAGFDRIWERPLTLDLEGSWQSSHNNWKKDESYWYTAKNKYDEGETQTAEKTARYNENNNLIRSMMLDPDGSSKKYYDIQTKVPIYIMRESDSRPDNGMAQLRLKALTTLSPDFLYTRLNVDNDANDDEHGDVNFVYDKDVNKSKIIVTDAVYVPNPTGGPGTVFYVGTVAAYGWVNQVDNVGTNDSFKAYDDRDSNKHDVARVHDGETSNTGRLSSYWIVSNDDGSATEVYKYSTKSDSTNIDHNKIRKALMNDASAPTTKLTANDDAGKAAEFFITIPVETVSSRLFTDVSFTLGYTSNREMVYTNIVYGRNTDGKLIQSLKFCETYYFKSHYGDENKDPYLYMNEPVDKLFDGDVDTLKYRNNAENDYYNVWFPGEMYNLTKIATKDNVTVAVGYAVAGSTYTYLNSNENGSTALGGIYNDGVLSAMVLGNDNALKSMLYFKDNDTFDGTSLSKTGFSYTPYNKEGTAQSTRNYSTNKGWTYGTHARDSVQFTCVDISIVHIEPFYCYYAYYADNKGRVFRSLVAYKGTDGGNPNLMSYVSDEIIEPCPLSSEGDYTDKSTPLGYLYNNDVGRMEEIKIGGQSMSQYFKEIKSIVCDDDHIVITGESNSSDFNIVVGTVVGTDWDDEKNQTACDITWERFKMTQDSPGNKYRIEDMTVVGDYIYAVGVSNINTDATTDDKGFIWAVSLDYIDTLSHDGVLQPASSTNPDGYYFYGDAGCVDLPMYAIAGKTT